MKNNNVTTMDLLGLLFVALQLTHQIEWSWWFITLPFWTPFCVIAIDHLIKEFPKEMAKQKNKSS